MALKHRTLETFQDRVLKEKAQDFIKHTACNYETLRGYIRTKCLNHKSKYVITK